MKKNIITLTLGLMTVIGAGAQERRNWNFTHGYSDETLAYIEQNITAGGDWTLESPGNYQIGDREAGPLTVNIDGTAWEIPETQGLIFGATDAKHIIVAYDNQNGYHGKQFLWINGSKDQDYFTIPKVAGGEKIFIVYESHKTTEERGVECTTEGIYVDGTTDQTVSKTLAIDTVVYSVPEAYGSAGVDVTFKATGGYHLYRVCVGQELYDDEPVVEKDKVPTSTTRASRDTTRPPTCRSTSSPTSCQTGLRTWNWWKSTRHRPAGASPKTRSWHSRPWW
jgi:hypothetical protein